MSISKDIEKVSTNYISKYTFNRKNFLIEHYKELLGEEFFEKYKFNQLFIDSPIGINLIKTDKSEKSIITELQINEQYIYYKTKEGAGFHVTFSHFIKEVFKIINKEIPCATLGTMVEWHYLIKDEKLKSLLNQYANPVIKSSEKHKLLETKPQTINYQNMFFPNENDKINLNLKLNCLNTQTPNVMISTDHIKKEVEINNVEKEIKSSLDEFYNFPENYIFNFGE